MNAFVESLPACGTWAMKVNAQAAVLVLIVLAVTCVSGRWLTPGWRSALWLVVFARLLVPFGPASGVSVFNVMGGLERDVPFITARVSDSAAIVPQHVAVPVHVGSLDREPAAHAARAVAAAASSTQGAWPAPVAIATAVWLLIASACVLRLLWQTVSLRRRLDRLPAVEKTIVTDLNGRCVAEVGLRTIPRLVLAPEGTGPALFGWLRPVLLLPRECVERMSRAELRLVLLHELRHARTGDYAVAWLLHLLTAVHWFNPLLWWARRRWQAQRELACDAWVMGHVGPRARRRYGAALLKIVESSSRGGLLVQGVGMAAFPTLIERRIRAMRRVANKTWKHWACGWAALLLLAAVGLTEAMPKSDAATAAVRDDAETKSSAAARDRNDDATTDTQAGPAEKAVPVEPRIIIAQHVILWDEQIVTWDEVVGRLRKIRAGGPFRAVFYTTNGVHRAQQDWQFWHDRIMGIYGELFEPVGVTFASASPRASLRFDAIRTADDLRPDPAQARGGRVLSPDGKPTVGAQVIVLPMTDVLGVALSGTALRDPVDEQWSPTDERGRFTVYPADDEYLLAVLHPAGFAFRRGPRAGVDAELELEPWTTVSFTTTGGVADQTASLTIRPTGADPESPAFRVYTVEAFGEPVDVPVPAGHIMVSRSLKMEEGTSISLPAESFTLTPGEKRTLSLTPPSDEDYNRALEFRNSIQRARNR